MFDVRSQDETMSMSVIDLGEGIICSWVLCKSSSLEIQEFDRDNTVAGSLFKGCNVGW